jgi:hydrogenase maturation protein HypF
LDPEVRRDAPASGRRIHQDAVTCGRRIHQDAVTCGRRIRLRGVTQGVGMRPYIHRVALECGVTGRARNSGAGVTIDAFGSDEALDRLLERLVGSGAGPGEIEAYDWEPLPGRAPRSFEIGRSRREGQGRIALAPDLATCPECRAEVADPANRRFGYAFTSCTACGPRFSIARDLPYDRERTSMDAFPLCAACRREYETPGDRRHHAETNACPDCGPQLSLAGPGGDTLARGAEALEQAARRLASGEILAVRGIGGYHLAVLAGDAPAVQRLRARKHRARKPFAVMVKDLAGAQTVAAPSPEEARLLASEEAPIVLLRRRPDADVADAVAPGLPWIGVMLAYTPLHQRLLTAVGRPLVMTSGNLSGEPIACAREEAEQRLGALVDGFLHHDREITAPCDDSVVQVVDARPRVLRRSRGFVPRALGLRETLPCTLLACGAQLASTFALGRGGEAWLSQHLGDLDSPEAVDGYARSVERMERWLGARAEVVACDLHPHYASTRFGLAREAALHVRVQHHHAHAMAAAVEHAIDGPALALVFDGTGLGNDGSSWGGELLLADASGFERLATLRPIALAGGEVAIREVWRLALAVLEDAFEGDAPLDALGPFRDLDADRVEDVRSLLRRGLRCVPAHGAGRWFDALGALMLELPEAAHSGDVATQWNAAARDALAPPYPFDLAPPPESRVGAEHAPTLEIDLRPMVRAAVADRLDGRAVGAISARFHATLAAASAAALARLRPCTGARPVVLSGGCFHNALLSSSLQRVLAPDWRVYAHERVPTGDGGIALGQLAIAASAARRGAV